MSRETGRSKTHEPITSIVVYVLHHADSARAKALAECVHRWFRRPTDAVWRARCGVPVYVRSAPFTREHALADDEPGIVGEPRADEPVQRPALVLRPFAHAKERGVLTFVVPLVDAYMATDARWMSLLGQLIQEVEAAGVLLTPDRLRAAPDRERPDGRPFVQFIPVSLDAYASQVHPRLGEVQGVNPGQWGDPSDATAAEAVRTARIRRELYLITIRTLRWLLTGRGADDPVHIFLSHAKKDGADGAGVAEALRDLTAGLGHVRAWYDATDLLPGTGWRANLKDAAGTVTAGLIACWSDSYSSRPWCLEELRQARTPRRVGGEAGDVLHRVWTVQPTVVLDLTRNSREWTSAPPELGGLPVIRWGQGPPDATPVDQVLFQSFQGLANAVYASRLLKVDQYAEAITWAPDPATMLALERSWGAKRPKRMLHPGYDGRGHTEGESGRLAPSGVELVNYDEARDEIALGAGLPPADALGGVGRAGGPDPLVQLSMGDPLDHAAMGFLAGHMEDLAYELSLALLGAGARLLYGGQPREHRPGEPTQLTEELAIAALGMERPDATDASAPRERVVFTVPWTGPLSVADRTRWLPVCRVVPVMPPRTAADVGTRSEEKGEAEWRTRVAREITLRNRHVAMALSHMRALAAEHASLVVLAGGRSKKFSGVMPGLLEEFVAARRKGRPILLLAGFGGTARQIAQHILGAKTPVPAWLLVDGGEKGKKFEDLFAVLERTGEAAWARDQWDEARKLLHEIEVVKQAGVEGVWVSVKGPRLVITSTESFRTVRQQVLEELQRVRRG